MRIFDKILFILLAIPSLCFAGSNYVQITRGVASEGGATTYCLSPTTCTATTPGECDSFCEDFNGSSYCVGTSGDANCRSTWEVFGLAGGSIDWTTVVGGTSPCNDVGSSIATVTITNGEATTIWTKSLGSPKNITYMQFYFRLVSESIPDNNSIMIIGTVDSGFTTGQWLLALYQESGNRYFSLLHSDASVEAVGTTALGVGTWYRVNVAYNLTAGTASVKVNGTTDINIPSGVTGSTPEVIALGSMNFSANQMTYQIMNLSVDDDTEPGTCN